MKFRSTRGKSPAVRVSEAMVMGLAPDGGLYVPESFPHSEFKGVAELAAVASSVLAPFFAGDPLERELDAICRTAFDFPVPLRMLKRDTAVLELFHGPTAAFKDFGARFLAACFARLPGPERTILVATSGDTGGAVAAAFHGKPGIRLKVLFPTAGVSPRQRKQLTCWDGNVESFAVRGSFDDCQRLVKAAFNDPKLRARYHLTSANSINIGRLLPQLTYYARAALEYQKLNHAEPAFIIPSGNLGNSVGALWARRMGFPIRRVCLATNANRAVADFLAGGAWQPRPSVRTLANAMDVGDPSNLERVRALYASEAELRRDLSALSVSDAEIREAIRRGDRDWGQVWCPHTATALHAREREAERDFILVATAHAAKFDEIVEPILGRAVPVPASLEALLKAPDLSREIEPLLTEIFA